MAQQERLCLRRLDLAPGGSKPIADECGILWISWSPIEDV